MRPPKNRNTASRTKRWYRRWIRAQTKWARSEGFAGLCIARERSGRTVMEWGGAHDEGWSYARRVYDPATMRVEHFDDGTDCDGRLTSGATCRVTGVSRLRCGMLSLESERVEAHRRDYEAERAGY